MQNDLLNRFLIKNSPIRGNIIKIQNSLEQLKTSLEIPKQIEEAFTQIITVCPMLAGTLKFDGGLILQIQGKKDLKLMIAESDNQFNIRGTLKLNQKTEKSFEELIKDAIFALTIVHKDQKAPYQGIIEIGSGNVKDMIEYYLTQSMQLKSKVFFYQTSTVSYGVLFQELPHENEDERFKSEKLWATINQIEISSLHNSPSKFLGDLFPDEDIQIYEEHLVNYKCSCCQEKIFKTISLINPDEIYASLKNDVVEMVCEYCQKKYLVTKNEIDIIFKKNSQILN
jgi:redox-regulated HSP33 family molecular chaperone